MLIKYLFALLFASLLLSGCSTANDSCLSQDAQKLIYKHIIEHSVELTNKKSNQLDNGSSVLSTDKIRSVLNQIHFEMDNVRTIRQNQGNITGVCKGQLEMSIPPPMLGEVDKARDARHLINMSQYARQLNIENNINVFTQKILDEIFFTQTTFSYNKFLNMYSLFSPFSYSISFIIFRIILYSRFFSMSSKSNLSIRNFRKYSFA
jgi:hypothetical protein